jgi:hypothetical protein
MVVTTAVAVCEPLSSSGSVIFPPAHAVTHVSSAKLRRWIDLLSTGDAESPFYLHPIVVKRRLYCIEPARRSGMRFHRSPWRLSHRVTTGGSMRVPNGRNERKVRGRDTRVSSDSGARPQKERKARDRGTRVSSESGARP